MLRIWRPWFVVLAWLTMVVVNALANLLPINDITTGEVSALYPTLIAPAGYVFSIWGVIYLGLGVYAIFQALPRQRQHPVLQRLAPWFIASCLANSLWIGLWHYQLLAASVGVMLALLATLIASYLILGIGRRATPAAERWLVHLPFSIYLGWITVATIANIAALLVGLGWDGWGLAPDLWTALMILAAGAVGCLVSWQRGDVAYVLVLVWALTGIIVKEWGMVVITAVALVVIVLLALVTALALPQRRRRLRSA